MRRLLLGAVLLLCVSATPARASEPVFVNWPQYLPALDSPAGTTGGPVPGCRLATLKCFDRVIKGLRQRRDAFGCDHRAVFAATYLKLTQVMLRTLKRDRHFFRDRRALIYEDVRFAQIYFNTLDMYAAGKPVDPAWQIALDHATNGDWQGSGDMLLGINAHVQNDMPFMLAALTLRDAKGRSRKADHDAENAILDDAFDEVVKELARRYDPLIAYETYNLSPVTDVFGVELVKIWREGVWRNAERLVNAKTDAERAQVAQSIHQQAEATAHAMEPGLIGPPGYRERRDAYCADQLDATT